MYARVGWQNGIEQFLALKLPLGGNSHILTIYWVCATVQGMVFKPFYQEQDIEKHDV